ncbi:sperm flagellar protein 1 [Leptinotarsa decemlineata]|uniref:sperm flagellar protein 1 n=1 Tax=Leptinotarsa decemlineata TaxID=7539 RepID=UPI000C253175|nr:sperm flagellar protein 1-like [Leptinotarsa decemlineata]
MNFDSDDLYKWIDSHTITRQKRNLNRDFSDALPLAEILKFHYPKIVDLHNYSPKNSFAQKLANWEMINKRVLKKLKINLSSEEREHLAKGTPGAIEKLLSIIKMKVENKASGDTDTESSRIYYLESGSNFSSREGIVPIKIKNGTKVIDRKMVPNQIFDKMEKDLAVKEETISVLRSKVDHLENLVKIKEERIKDLTQQLQAVVNNNSGSESSSNMLSSKTRFFNKIFQ